MIIKFPHLTPTFPSTPNLQDLTSLTTIQECPAYRKTWSPYHLKKSTLWSLAGRCCSLSPHWLGLEELLAWVLLQPVKKASPELYSLAPEFCGSQGANQLCKTKRAIFNLVWNHWGPGDDHRKEIWSKLITTRVLLQRKNNTVTIQFISLEQSFSKAKGLNKKSTETATTSWGATLKASAKASSPIPRV